MKTKTKPGAKPRPPLPEDPPRARALFLLILAAEETAARLAGDLKRHRCREPARDYSYASCQRCVLQWETRNVQAFLSGARLDIESSLYHTDDGIDRAVSDLLQQLPGLLHRRAMVRTRS